MQSDYTPLNGINANSVRKSVSSCASSLINYRSCGTDQQSQSTQSDLEPKESSQGTITGTKIDGTAIAKVIVPPLCFLDQLQRAGRLICSRVDVSMFFSLAFPAMSDGFITIACGTALR